MRPFNGPPTHTPQPVIDALQTIAAHLRDTGRENAVVAKTGGASFEITSVYEQKERLYDALAEQEERITRAIAHANKYRHPGTNAGDHKVLSEMVEILEGGGTQ